MTSNGRSGVLDDARRRALLTELQTMGSDADAHEDIEQIFLPLPMHAAALRPEKLIVRGERGAGKTALFHLLRALAERRDASLPSAFPGAPSVTGRWIEGFSERGKAHPGTHVLDQFGNEAEDRSLRSFWFGHLVGVLLEAFPGVDPPAGDFAAR